MFVSIVVVGIGQWLEYTEPYIKSLLQFEPGVKVVVVDNGSVPRYSVSAVRFEKVYSYAASINAGLRACPSSDWYVVSNNDVLCNGSFVEALEKLDPDTLYGNKIHGNDVCERYVDGWIYFISRQVWDAVGLFDERFLIAAYEDIDYSTRAVKAGIPIEQVSLPFQHLEERIRYTRPNYDEVYEENRNYFMVKHGIE